MPLTLNCPSCKNVVEIPADHFEATIHCGICWAEIIVDRPPVVAEDEAIEVQFDASPMAVVSPFESIPGRAAQGMESLEPLLAQVSLRMPQLLIVPDSKPLKEEDPLAAEPVVSKNAPQREEDCLRRKRGQASNLPVSPEILPKAEEDGFPKLLLLIGITITVFIAGYLLMR